MEEALGRQLAITGRMVRERFDGCLNEHGASLTTWAVLRSAHDEDGLSQRELASRMSIESPTLVRHLDRLEEEGLVVRRRDEMLLSRAHLKRERTLRGFGQELVGLEPLADLARKPEPVESARREHDGVEPPLGALPQTGVDIAPQRFDRQRRLECKELRLASSRRRADAHSRSDRVRAAQRVAWIVALQIRADDKPRGIGGRHVLGRMHRNVDAMLEQRLFELLDEDAA